MDSTATWIAQPSLALTKYWGKLPESGRNIPASTSIAVTLAGLHSSVRATPSDTDSVELDGVLQPVQRFAPVFAAVRKAAGVETRFACAGTNSFPTAAGLASSSSGLAAMTLACLECAGLDPLSDRSLASRIAREGSGSAARALWGGFTRWLRGSAVAEPLHGPEFWPELRVFVVIVSGRAKPVGSREAMEHARVTSSGWQAWLDGEAAIADRATRALATRDLEGLGTAMRESYLSMFATMFTSKPPVIYWLPESIRLIHLAAELRASGIPVWETMDAGPQVKLFTVESASDAVREALKGSVPDLAVLESRPGEGPRRIAL